jgi:hypothetical protein
LADAELGLHAGRAWLLAGSSYARAGERAAALRALEIAARLCESGGARAMHAEVIAEQRRLAMQAGHDL